MVPGKFINDNTPIIRIPVAWNSSLQIPYFILDTGFTGDLQVTPKIAEELGLEITGVENVRIANGQMVFDYKAVVDCKYKTVMLERIP